MTLTIAHNFLLGGSVLSNETKLGPHIDLQGNESLLAFNQTKNPSIVDEQDEFFPDADEAT